jgi:hypothetical protein
LAYAPAPLTHLGGADLLKTQLIKELGETSGPGWFLVLAADLRLPLKDSQASGAGKLAREEPRLPLLHAQTSPLLPTVD